MSWPGKHRRQRPRDEAPEALPADDETDYQTLVVVNDDRMEEAEALLERLGSREEVAKQRPDLLVPQIHLDIPNFDFADSQFLLDSRPPLAGEVPDWAFFGKKGRRGSREVRVLEDADLWVRPGADAESARLLLRSRRLIANVEGVLTLALHAKHDAEAIDLTRRKGYDFVPAYEMPMDVAAWTVPVWRDVAKAKRWMLCCLFGEGKPVADLAINGTNIVVEV
jgi:hypothetical protein